MDVLQRISGLFTCPESDNWTDLLNSESAAFAKKRNSTPTLVDEEFERGGREKRAQQLASVPLSLRLSFSYNYILFHKLE